MFRLSLISAVTLLLFFSCEKEDLPDAPGDRLKMIRHKAGDTIWYRSFQYDVQNRLIAMVDSGHGGIFSRAISYDAQGKMANIVAGDYTFTFDFDNKGRIIRKWGIFPGQPAIIVNTYAYDIDDRVIADSLYDYWNSNVYRVVSYSYDQHNNIRDCKMIEASSGMQIRSQQRTYDDHVNPLDDKNIVPYLVLSGHEIPTGNNNPLKDIYHDGTEVNYVYEYYSNGLPKSCRLLDSSDPLVIYYDFYYE